MSFLKPKVYTPPPPPAPEPIAEPDYKRAAALSDEAATGGAGGSGSPTLLG